MNGYVRRYPKYGDIFFIDEKGRKRFVAGADITTEEADSLQAVGVVYDVNGKNFDVVAGVNDKTFPWSVACDFEITAIPYDSGSLAVKLHNVDLGNFDYVKNKGTKDEFVTQLNTWLETNAPKWEAYMESEETAILQLSDYTDYEYTCTIAGCTLVKRVGLELDAETVSFCRNQVLQRTIYNGCCRARLEEWVTNNTDTGCNPTTRMDGVTQLFVTFPCSKAYFDGKLGDGLRANFATYQDYLDACMVRPLEAGVGIMQYKDGKTLADKLLDKTLLVRGVETKAYPAAVWADEYDCGVEGYGKGTFHWSGMSETSRLMRDMTNGTSLPLDPINISLGKRTGWSKISSTSNRSSCCRFYSSHLWGYGSYGICALGYFYSRSNVSAVARFTLDDEEHEYDGENVIKKYPSKGDIFIIKDGKKRFIAWQTATKEFVDQQQAVGVVFHVMGKRFLVVGGQNTTTKKWSAVADYEITAIPSESGSYAVKLLNVAVGDFTYTKSEGTIEEFVTQLNTWLETNAPKWEAYMYNGKGYLQMSIYDAHERTVSIAGTTLVKLIGNELAASTTTANYNEHGDYHGGWGLGMCRQRIEEYCKTQTRAECNPTSRLDGVTQIMGQLPCSETYFNGELGDGLRANYATYQDYIDDCMVRTWELNRGIMQYRDGRELTNLLLPKKVLIRGVETPCYSAAHFANDFDCGVEGYGAGTFYLPSMHELGLLMRGITNGTTKALDPVNVALSKRTGWTQICSTANRWACCRYYTNGAWAYGGYGYTGNHYFCNGLTVSAVSAFEL